MIKGIVNNTEKEITRIAMIGDGEETATGTNRIEFVANGEDVISCSIEGNLSQSSVPSTSTPVYPSECGEKTEQIFDKSSVDIYEHTSLGTQNVWGYDTSAPGITFRIPCDANTQYTLSINNSLENSILRIASINSNTAPIPGQTGTIQCVTLADFGAVSSATFTTLNDTKYIVVQLSSAITINAIDTLMLNTGSAPLPYVPYGYSIPLTLNDQTIPLYLSEPIRKIGTYADSVGSADTVTRKIKKLVLTGNENWSRDVASGTFYTDSCTDYLCTSGITCTSSHYVGVENVSGASAAQPGISFITNPDYYRLYIKDFNFSSIEAFTTFLRNQYSAGTPVTVWYVLATPSTESITFPNLPTSEGSNVLTIGTSLAPSSTSITYIGLKNTYKEGWEVRDGEGALIWGANKTLTSSGTPISFKGYGTKLKDYKVSGDMTQYGVETTINGESPLTFTTNSDIIDYGIEGNMTQDGIDQTMVSTPPLSFVSTDDGISDYSIVGNIVQSGGRSAISGTSPLSFKSDGSALTDYSITGNMVQSGTPSTSSPIYPQECGDKTGNIWYGDSINGAFNAQGGYVLVDTRVVNVTFIEVIEDSYTIGVDGNNEFNVTMSLYDSNKDFISLTGWQTLPYTVDTSQCSFIRVAFRYKDNNRISTDAVKNIMLNSGSTALPYEPYGVKLPLTCGGNTYPIYLQEPIRKIGDYADVAGLSINGAKRKIKKLTLTGSEEVTLLENQYYKITLPTQITDRNNFLCSHFYVGAYSDAIAQGQARGGGKPSYNFIFNYDNGSGGTTGFKTFLANQYANGTPVSIWYVSDTESTEQITMPTVTTVSGNNTLTVGTTLAPTKVGITYANTDSPKPDNPIYPKECGDRTAQLYDGSPSSVSNLVVDANRIRADQSTKSLIIPCSPSTTYTMAKVLSNRFIIWGIRSYPTANNTDYTERARGNDQTSLTFTTGSEDIYLLIMVSYGSSTSISEIVASVMLNLGSTALPYEPYGVKIPITCGSTYPIYLSEPIRKIGDYADIAGMSIGGAKRRIKKLVFDGTENFDVSRIGNGILMLTTVSDYLHTSANICILSHFATQENVVYWYNVADKSAAFFYNPSSPSTNIFFLRDTTYNNDADGFKSWLAQQYAAGTPVTVWYALGTPETETATMPQIPTATGSNTLSIGTTLPPSSVSLTFTSAGVPAPNAPITPLEVGNLVSSGAHSGEYAVPITCGGSTQNIYIDEPIRKIGDYRDVIDMTINGVERRIKKLVLTGMENWTDRPNFTYCDRFVLEFGNRPYKESVCSHFVTSTTLVNDFPCLQVNGMVQIVVNFSAKGTTSLADFKQWLSDQYNAGTPVIVWYVLTTPETESTTTPVITTASGNNTLSVDTTYKPSNISLTYANTGNPTPDVPIYPYEVGERTKNLLQSAVAATKSSNGIIVSCDGLGTYHVSGTANGDVSIEFTIPEFVIPISVGSGGTGTMALFNGVIGSALEDGKLDFYYNDTRIDGWQLRVGNRTSNNYNDLMNSKKINKLVFIVKSGIVADADVKPMFTGDGIIPQSYEPYGYRIPVICGGTTQNMYLQEPIRKIGNYVDNAGLALNGANRKIKKLVLTGNEGGWTASSSYPGGFYHHWRALGDGAGSISENNAFLCSHAKYVTSLSDYLYGTCFSDSACNLRIMQPGTTVNEFVNYLRNQVTAGTPVTIWCILSSDQTETSALPTIRTIEGNDTLSIPTSLSPSAIEITGHFKPLST